MAEGFTLLAVAAAVAEVIREGPHTDIMREEAPVVEAEADPLVSVGEGTVGQAPLQERQVLVLEAVVDIQDMLERLEEAAW